MKEMNPNQHQDPVYAVWQAEIQKAGKRPYLASILLQKGHKLYRRFVHYYLALQSLSRRSRRQLMQKFAVGLGGLALAMALNGGPVIAANITVETSNPIILEDNLCSINEAIANANNNTTGISYDDCAAGTPNGADTIILSGNTYLINYANEDLYGNTGLHGIRSDITIDGNGATLQRDIAVRPALPAGVIIDPDFRILSVAEGASLTLDDVTVTGGNLTDDSVGGAIYSYQGDVILRNNTVISGNYATQDGGGIGIYSYDAPANLTITDSTISGNSTNGSGGGIYVYNYEGTNNITLTDSVVSGNTANQIGGGIYSYSYYDSSTITISNSTISGNSVLGPGGGVYNAGYLTSHVTIDNNSQITNNESLAAFGGGVTNMSFYVAEVTVQGNSVISGNEAGFVGSLPSENPTGALPFVLSSGGGIFNSNNGLPLGTEPPPPPSLADGVENTAVSSFTQQRPRLAQRAENPSSAPQAVAGSYGASVTINNSTITGNSVNGSGGGVSNIAFDLGAVYVLNDAAVTNNTAVSDPVIPSLFPPHGGGLYNKAVGCECLPEAANPFNPMETPAGGLPPFGNIAYLMVNLSAISGNTAVGNGGGIYNYASGQALVNVINNATISDNNASGLPLTAETTLADKRSNRHQQVNISGGEPPATIFGLGGGIFNDSYYGSSPETLTADEAPNRIEGIPPGYSRVMIDHSTISGNTANFTGGGVANHSYGVANSMVQNNARISNNISTTGFGGGLSTYGYGFEAATLISDSWITGNQAQLSGGGVDNYSYYGDAEAVVSKSTISGNAANYGGGLYSGSDDGLSNTVLSNSTISGNSAAGHGGGIDNHTGSVILTHTTVTNNSAPLGGGIYSTASINLYNSIVASNPTGGDCSGTITSGGYNLDSDGTCVTDGVNNDMTVADPLLGLLQNNAPGNTPTHALLAGSPAIDAIPADVDECGLLADDQRGVARPQGDGCDMGAFELSQGAYQTFLPIVLKDGIPDLIVTNLDASGGNIQVTIRNQGTRTVNEDFWVDLYLNPSPAPTAVNQVWKFVGQYGAAWGVTADLAPGEELTLKLNDTYFDPAESNLPATIAAGTIVYAQVDAAHLNTTYGAVLENHEINNGAYNNISGPQTASVPITTSILNFVSGLVTRLGIW